jgi:UDP-2-acetamido-3-amino-2,3-dideoxy-glucuronate N-acetyltransferase
MNKNIGLIGCGYWGKNLVRNFYKLNSLYAICDIDQENLKLCHEKYANLTLYSDHKSLIRDSKVKAVVIATPAASHYELAKEALGANKHVFVEKPLALRVEEAEELVELAQKKKKILMVGHVLRYHPAVDKLKELIDEGDLGKIQYIYSNRVGFGKLRSEENILWSFAPHDISVILFLLNEFPHSVLSTGESYLQHNIADVTLTVIDFKNGVKAHIFVSWLHPFKEQKLVVVGDKKMAVFNDMSDEKLLLYPHEVEWVHRAPVASNAEAVIVPIKMEEPLRLECKHFCSCIKNNLVPKTNGEESLRVLRILEASQESLDGKGIKIKFDEFEKSDKHKELEFFVHESSFIDENVKIGGGTKIWHFSHVLKGSEIGKNCTIGQNVVIGPDVKIGKGCKIQNNVSVNKGVTLEDEVFIGPAVVFTNIINPRAFIERKTEFKATLVKRGASIGGNATIICGTSIGEYAFVGAGSLVNSNVSDCAFVVGYPARQIGWVCRCGTPLKFDESGFSECEYCRKKYESIDGKIHLIED